MTCAGPFNALAESGGGLLDERFKLEPDGPSGALDLSCAGVLSIPLGAVRIL